MSAKKSDKIQLILIFAIPVVGLLLMTAYYFYITGNHIRTETHNYGVLLTPPKQIEELAIRNQGVDYSVIPGGDKWTFLVIGSAHCDASCQQKLYLSRQIKEALGKYSARINTIYLSVDGGVDTATASLFANDYAGHELLVTDADKARAWFAKNEPEVDMLSPSFYVIDPRGWVMMYYREHNTYKEVIKDMKFLLKNS